MLRTEMLNCIKKSAGRHENGATGIAGLPLHPVPLRGTDYSVAMAFVALRGLRLCEKGAGGALPVLEHEPVKVDMAVFVGQRCAQPVFQMWRVEGVCNLDDWALARSKFGDPFNSLPLC